MNRKIRGLEDYEGHERKRFLRDIRPLEKILIDALATGNVQTVAIFASGFCMVLVPTFATPLFLFGLAMFAARCHSVKLERLPFRMPLGMTGEDKGVYHALCAEAEAAFFTE